MNRQPSSQPNRQPGPRRGLGLTSQQIVILSLVALLGLSALGLAAALLLGPKPTPSTQQSIRPSPSQTPPVANHTPTAIAQASLVAFQLPAGCKQTSGSAVQAQVTRVVDSRTLEVTVAGRLQRIGFAGIDVSPLAAPETLPTNALPGNTILLVRDLMDQDADGRALRYIFFAGQFLNLTLVQEGAATVQTDSPNQACAALFAQAQQQAVAEHRGVWKLTPVPTQTFMPLVSLVPSTQVAGCDCSARPTCDQFKTHAAAQACYNACQDYNTRLDDDHNGIACENLP